MQTTDRIRLFLRLVFGGDVMGMKLCGSFLTPVGNIAQTRKRIEENKAYKIASNYENDEPKILRGRRGVFISLPEESPAATVYVGNNKVEVGSGIPVCSGTGLFIPIASGEGDLWMVADLDCWVNIAEWQE